MSKNNFSNFLNYRISSFKREKYFKIKYNKLINGTELFLPYINNTANFFLVYAMFKELKLLAVRNPRRVDMADMILHERVKIR